MLRFLAPLMLLPLSTASAQQVFTHEMVTLTFPSGWTAKPPPSAQEGLLATFSASAISASGVMSTAQGNLKDLLQQGRTMVLGGLPGAIPDSLVHELKTSGGDNVLMQSFTGTAVHAGKEIPLGVLLAATMNGRRGLLVQVYFGPANVDRVSREFIQLIQSIQ